MARKEEAKLQDKFIALLKREGILHIKTSGGMSWLPDGKGGFKPIRQKEGFADVIIFDSYRLYLPNDRNSSSWKIEEPTTYFVELKTNEGELRDTQIEKFKALTEKGFKCFILRPKHWEAVKEQGRLSFISLYEEMEVWNEN